MRYIFVVAIAVCSTPLTACSSPESSVAETPSVSSKQPGGNTNESVAPAQNSDSVPAHPAAASHETESPQIRGEFAEGDNQPPAGRAVHSHHNDSASQNDKSNLADSGPSSRTGGDNSIAIGDQVPDFEVMIAGKKLTLSELRQDGEVAGDGAIVLTFWCSFCHSCRHVEGNLDALATKYRGRAAVIALDASAGESLERVAAVAKENRLELPIALDSSGRSADIFGTRVTTTTVVIDKHGVLRYRGQFGNRQDAFAENALKAVLAGEDVKVSETRQKG